MKHRHFFKQAQKTIIAFALSVSMSIVFTSLLTVSILLPTVLGWWIYSPIDYKMIVFPLGGLLSSFFTAYGIIKSLKEYFLVEHIGLELENKDVDEISAELSNKLGVERFHKIFIGIGGNVETYYINGYRYLTIGFLTLKHLTTTELKSVIAHEYAHHIDKGMLIGRAIFRGRMFYKGFLTSFNIGSARLRSYLWENKLYTGFVTALSLFAIASYYLTYFFIYLFHAYLSFLEYLFSSPDDEHFCDHVAKTCVGGDALGFALEKIHDILLSDMLISRDGITINEARYLNEFDIKFEKLKDENSEARLQSMATATKTHPSITSRLDRISVSSKFRKSCDNTMTLSLDESLIWSEVLSEFDLKIIETDQNKADPTKSSDNEKTLSSREIVKGISLLILFLIIIITLIYSPISLGFLVINMIPPFPGSVIVKFLSLFLLVAVFLSFSTFGVIAFVDLERVSDYVKLATSIPMGVILGYSAADFSIRNEDITLPFVIILAWYIFTSIIPCILVTTGVISVFWPSLTQKEWLAKFIDWLKTQWFLFTMNF